MKSKSRPIHLLAWAAGLACALSLNAGVRANDAPAEAAKPLVAKPAVAPASGSLVPAKPKPAGAAPDARGAAEPAKAATAALGEAKPAKAAPQSDEALKKMLTERLAGSGDLILKTSDATPKQAEASPAKPSKRAARVDAADLAAAHRAAQATEHLPHWAYGGAGAPEKWSTLDPAFSTCASGKHQSPIDIRDGIKVGLDPVVFDYQPSGFRVVDNGHTIQVNVGLGNAIEVLGRRYDLVQFHFHRPSEERVNGRQTDMVAHLVHKDLEGHLAVVAVLLTRGSPQPVVQTVWNNLPLERNEELSASVPIDLIKLLPEERRYFTYMGSLTTPPCSEGVLWMVMKTPVQISPEQIAIFSRLYPMNARPVQALNARLIKESN
ncbi:MAG: carbonic anhydrase family protein [Betaproteobacteria bacterium]|nr:carbonic anhydrase family protein [Betaproteobacteria bacterium]